MVAFTTLFLGLVFGTMPLKVMVSPQVATVEVLLDGVRVGVLKGEPWKTEVDFGNEPHPHVLEAVARDTQGRVVGRIRQLVNVPRAQSEASLLIDPPAQGGGVLQARMVWDSSLGTKVKKVRVQLDGKRLKVKDPRSFPLPPTDLRQAHVLSAEVFLPGTLVAVAATAFGGEMGEQSQAELTAVPLMLGPGATLPESEGLQGWFAVDNVPARVVGVEKGEAQVIFVIDRNVTEIIRKLPRAMKRNFHLSRSQVKEELEERQTFFLNPVALEIEKRERVSRRVFVFDETEPFDTRGILHRFAQIPLDENENTQQQMAEGVAQAGVFAAGSKKRRAVVVVWAGALNDKSVVTPRAVRCYLEDLHVPLVVWAIQSDLEEKISTPWGEALNLTSPGACSQAEEQLRGILGAQRIVWLDGALLPNRIRLAQATTGVHLAP